MIFYCRLKISPKCERVKTAHDHSARTGYYNCRFCLAVLPSPSERMHRIFERLNCGPRGKLKETGNG